MLFNVLGYSFKCDKYEAKQLIQKRQQKEGAINNQNVERNMLEVRLSVHTSSEQIA